jgi:hypothetical protein
MPGSGSVLGQFNGLPELHAFYNQPAQVLHDPEKGLELDVKETMDRAPNVGPLAKIYGWGPKSGDWETLGRWQVKWLSPFSGWPEVRASLPTLPPGFVVDQTRAGSYGYYGGYSSYGSGAYTFTPGDDGSHGLLTTKRLGRGDPAIFELEADRAPLEIHRADGEPFGDIDGVVRAAGRWFVATPPGQATVYGQQPVATSTIIWQVEGAIARELVRVPRSLPELQTYLGYGARTAKLARRSDGRAIGLLADGQPTAERSGSTSTRWVLPIDLETGALGEPELLGYVDLAGRTLEACTDDMVGWVLDSSMPSGSSVHLNLPKGTGSLQSVNARLRLTTDRACIERLGGNYDGQSAERAAQLARPGAPTRGMIATKPGDIVVAATSSLVRYPLRCTIAH